ncbi:similar to alpha/beta superfamily hydrolase [Botrytis cinerea T4]|uniref:Similar to alpha/beta superfamily hydrolase n=1 Tax=Botryotinia fuckeliana (strain T4) TaxID=999810 RepID=G2XST8_BOTF4|nr:similar to alpha/beta superfamily hydrolase [Botrytis cinerea T4]
MKQPGLPPNSRQETIANYQKECLGIKWREEKIRSTDNTAISLCVAEVSCGSATEDQGNAASLPPRLPFLSTVPRKLEKLSSAHDKSVQYVFVCCSYRGYWKSRGRPSEKGLMKDAEATMQWVKKDLEARPGSNGCDIVLWGQSIGAGIVTGLAAKGGIFSDELRLQKLILETPFLGIKAMLETLYPQKWLPYRHLHPFLRNHLDSWKALGEMHERTRKSGSKPPRILILQAGKDELVPESHGGMLEKRCSDLVLEVRKEVIQSALHNEVLVRGGGSTIIAEAIRDVVNLEYRGAVK